jgi:hypothetical protein
VIITYHAARGLTSAGTVGLALAACVVSAWIWYASIAAFAIAFLMITLCALARLLAGPALIGPSAVWETDERRGRVDLEDEPVELTIVVPFYNPGAVLRTHLFTLVETLERERVTFEVIAVSDGSTDHSEQLVAELEPRGVRTIVLERNQGKGVALHVGLAAARGRYLGFIDADGDIPSELWHTFLVLMRMYEADMVIGSKRHALSDVHYPLLRQVYSHIYQHMVHVLFRIDVADTQTGIKLFRREVLADVLPLIVERGFVFDLELLVVARRRGWRRVLEAPVRVEHRFRSTISIGSVVRMIRQTVWLALRLHVLRSYDTPSTASSSLAGIARRTAFIADQP